MFKTGIEKHITFTKEQFELLKKDFVYTIANYFEKCVEIGINPNMAANYVNGIITSYINEKDISIKDFYLKEEYLKQIVDKQIEGVISSKQAKEIFYKSKIEESLYIENNTYLIFTFQYENTLTTFEFNVLEYKINF